MTKNPVNSTSALTNNRFDIPVSDRPIGIACSRDGKLAIVTHDHPDGEVTIIELATLKVIKIIKVGVAVRAIAVSPDNKYIVVCWQNGAFIISVNTLEVVSAIEKTGSDVSVEFSPDGKRLYFCKLSAPQLLIMDFETKEVLHSIWDAKSPQAIAISPTRTKAYFSSDNGMVNVLDVITGEVINSIEVGKNPIDVAINSDGSLLCVCDIQNKTISLVDLEDERVVSTTPVESSPWAVAISHDDQHAYVALDEGGVSVIDLNTFKEVGRLGVGRDPVDIAVDRTGSFVCTANLTENSVSVISLRSAPSEETEDFESVELQKITEVKEVMSTGIFNVTLLEKSDPGQSLEFANIGWNGEQVKGNLLYNFDVFADRRMVYSLELVVGVATSVVFWVAGGNIGSSIPYVDVWFFDEFDNELNAQHFVGTPYTFLERMVDSGRLEGIRKIKIRTNGQFLIDNITVKRG
ncbi:WD40 repeat domain-containing protein [Pseudomonas sp. BGI-2]|uniref:WD40 repeat domain-containing protein n=1 Tax=Pseudomonas sp. BGI-2 TaxID=2528211 RepID=UPI0010349CF0|nr:YncE family protein [Pseudomonas sp. BGI-2]TBN36536.1 YncE family protein [Pseudomonas sp. BGI-2]